MGTEELSDVVAHLVCFCLSCSYRKFERVNSTAIPVSLSVLFYNLRSAIFFGQISVAKTLA